MGEVMRHRPVAIGALAIALLVSIYLAARGLSVQRPDLECWSARDSARAAILT
jgi:hypothetical protein